VLDLLPDLARDGHTAPASGAQELWLEPGDVLRCRVSAPPRSALELGLRAAGDGALEVVALDAASGAERTRWSVPVAPEAVERKLSLAPAGEGPVELVLELPAGAPRVALGRAALAWEHAPVPFVLIVVDTLRWDAVFGPGGAERAPRVHALAADGARFDRAFAHAPITLPSHASLFSSRMPHETGVLNNLQRVGEELPLVGDWLSARGYATQAVLSMGTVGGRHRSGTLFRAFDLYDRQLASMVRAEHVDRRVEAALRQRPAGRPLFLFAHYSDPHAPYSAHGTVERRVDIAFGGEVLDRVLSSELTIWRRLVDLRPGENTIRLTSDHAFDVRRARCLGGEELPVAVEGRDGDAGGGSCTEATLRIDNDTPEPIRRELLIWVSDHLDRDEIVDRYALEVAYVDRYVGELVDELRREGLYDDSLVVFTSDHGEELHEHGHIGHVMNLYDPALHVPLVVKPPRGHPALERLARRRHELVRHVDVVPTVLELLGYSPLPGQRGTSLLRDAERLLLAETHRPQALATKLCVRDERYKLIYEPEADRFEMYDVESDPGEQEDVFAERADERPVWPSLLRSIAADDQFGDEIDPGALEPEERAELEALGYM